MSRNRARRYLTLKGNIWWFKRNIPSSLQKVLGGKTAYLASLETSDVIEAARRRDEVALEVSRLFADAKAGRPLASASGQDFIRALGERWAAELKASRADPHSWHRKATGSDPEGDDGRVSILTAEGLIEDEAEQIAREHGSAAGERFLNIAHGRLDVDHHLSAYLKEAGLAPKTTKERGALVRRFAAWAAEKGHAMADITRPVAGSYVTAFLVPMNRRTASKHLTALSQYWDYLRRRGHVPQENPWKEQLLPENRKRVERGAGDNDEREFTAVEMQKLLYPVEPVRTRGGGAVLMADVMRIAALSGMRVAEIITLWASDVKLGDDDVGIFDLQQGKNQNAAREVPIHPGLLGIVKRRLKGKSGKDWLFPELVKHAAPADAFGKRFASYRRAQGVDDKREGQRRSLVNFHSFRRWFITEAERAGQPVSIIASVVGHEEGRRSITLGVYSGGPSDEQKRACVVAVKLPEPKATDAIAPTCTGG